MKIQHIWTKEFHSHELNSATSGQLATTETKKKQLEEAPGMWAYGKGETEERREEEGTDFLPVN